MDGQVPAAAGVPDLEETPKKPSKLTSKKNKLLGKGKYGSVFECTFKGTTVAVKRLQLLDCDEAAKTERMREGNAMTNLVHPNVLRLITEQEDDNFK
jgi:hypothetical protein